ncbi:MAG TPA: YbaK/EbsC family protein [Gaiellales bacterium]|nr:YbaK/EbsC family protein [Gaiellales bacterium]
MSETRGTTALRRAGIEHRLLRYAYTADGGALQAAADLGVEPARMFKSLVAKAGDDLVFALVAADAVLSPKKLAAAASAKHAVMADPREAERATGYQVGGISPLGSRKALRVFLDTSAEEFPRICLNAGNRGHIVEVATADLVQLTGATVADLRAVA